MSRRIVLTTPLEDQHPLLICLVTSNRKNYLHTCVLLRRRKALILLEGRRTIMGTVNFYYLSIVQFFSFLPNPIDMQVM